MELELFALFIPLLFIVVFATLFKNKVVWWEYCLLFFIPLIFLVLLHHIFIINLTNDYKNQDAYIVKVEYYEDWNEYIQRTCYRSVSCGKNCTTQVAYDCSYVDYHPEYYQMIDNYGNVYNINKNKYNSLIKQFNTKIEFKNLNRSYHTIDGDMYYFLYNNDLNKIEVVTYTITYENKTQASENLFKFEKITKDEIESYGLFDYPPKINNFQKSVLGKELTKSDELKMKILNGYFSKNLNLKTFVIFVKNKPIEYAFKQESYWMGGNNNEFVICISEDNYGNVQWIKTFSWMDKPVLEKSFENEFRQYDKISIDDIYNYLKNNLDKWEYNDFKEFEYIQIKITNNQLIWLYIIIFIITCCLSVWVYKNEFEH